MFYEGQKKNFKLPNLPIFGIQTQKKERKRKKNREIP